MMTDMTTTPVSVFEEAAAKTAKKPPIDWKQELIWASAFAGVIALSGLATQAYYGFGTNIFDTTVRPTPSVFSMHP